MIRAGEVLEPLAAGLRIIQDHRDPCFTEDALLLAHFAAAEPAFSVVELGCGSGVIALLLAQRWPQAQVVGLELMERMAERAARSVAENELAQRVQIVCGDLCQAAALLGRAQADLVVVNPPYQVRGQGRVKRDPLAAAAACELWCTLEDVVREAALLLRPGGRLALIQRYERLAETRALCVRYGLAVCRQQAVRTAAEGPPQLFLWEARRQEAADEQVLPDLVLREQAGCRTAAAWAIVSGAWIEEDK